MRGKIPTRPSPAQRRILIVDHHPLVRRGLIALIAVEPDLMVCAEAATRQEGLAAVGSSKPDLVIADFLLADGDGLALVRDIRSSHESLPVLVMSMNEEPGWARSAFRAGAVGYLTKTEPTDALLNAIRRVLDGETYLSPGMSPGLEGGESEPS